VALVSGASALLVGILVIGYAPFSPFSPFEGLWSTEVDVYEEVGKLRTPYGGSYAIHAYDWAEWSGQVQQAGGQLREVNTWEEFTASLEGLDVTFLMLDDEDEVVWCSPAFADQTTYLEYVQLFTRPSLPVLLFVVLSFFPSLVVLTFFFAQILSGRSRRRTNYRSAFIISLCGLAVSTAIALAAPLIPGSIPVLDVSIVLAAIAWVLLLRYYCGTGWLESLPPAFIAVIIYVAIVAVASGFSTLLLAE